MPISMIIFDNHMHLQFQGENVEAIKRFEKSGGTHINLTNVPNYEYPMDSSYYGKIYKDTLRLAELVRKNTEVKVLVTIGPYPVDMVELMKRGTKTEEAKELEPELKQAMEEAGADKVKTEFGSFTLITRYKYEYSDEVKKLENELKELKRKEEESGIAKVTELKSLMFR